MSERTLILSNPLPYLDLLIPWRVPPQTHQVKPPEVKRPLTRGSNDLLRSFDFGRLAAAANETPISGGPVALRQPGLLFHDISKTIFSPSIEMYMSEGIL